MKKFSVVFIVALLAVTNSFAQSFTSPVTILKSGDTSKPLIFYMSGDGGWTSFSKAFTRSLNSMGYPVIGLDSHDYFWKKKTPQETADKVNGLLDQYLAQWGNRKVVLIGYSFGADVTPFVATRLSRGMADRIQHVVLMLPYKSTDFEVHLSEMLGFSESHPYKVASEVNKLSYPVLFILSTEKNDFPLNELSIKDYRIKRIKGDHHFDEKAKQVAQQVVEGIG